MVKRCDGNLRFPQPHLVLGLPLGVFTIPIFSHVRPVYTIILDLDGSSTGGLCLACAQGNCPMYYI